MIIDFWAPGRAVATRRPHARPSRAQTNRSILGATSVVHWKTDKKASAIHEEAKVRRVGFFTCQKSHSSYNPVNHDSNFFNLGNPIIRQISDSDYSWDFSTF